MSDLSQSPKESIKVKENEILIVKQTDGNWKGYMNRDGNPLEVREIDPYTCLIKLLTHE
jgi:hypothetical protein